VSGLVVVSSAEDGSLVALLDAAAVTAVRTGAAAVLAAETLGRADAETAAVVGAGVNGEAAALSFAARGRTPLVWDLDGDRAAAVADRAGGRVASRDDTLAADLLVTVTPGREVLLPEGSLRPGQHVSLMGADGPGKAEIAVAELARVRVFCDDWEQASHGGECAAAVEAGALGRDDVTGLGDVLAGSAAGRESADAITAFDSTGVHCELLTPGDAVRLLSTWAGMAAGSEGVLIGWYATEERMALVRFWDGGPLLVPADSIARVEPVPKCA
jgi:ornithine cyclodeaminase/alanine dehydrogenase-like protein (mu-crystallin family)